MPSNTDRDSIRRIADIAMSLMAANEVPPTPQNYSVWYAYAAGGESDLVRAIDILLSNDQGFSDERNADLHHRFFGQDREGETLRQASARIQEALEAVMAVITSADGRARRYGDDLAALTDDLEAVHDFRRLREVVDRLAAETQAMSDHNRRLGQELSDTSQKMDKMRRDLEAVRREAATDNLTGLPNRKSFDLMLRHAAAASMEGGAALSLLMVDIDCFKKFNDSYGHQTGDQVLKLVARVLRDSVKGRDTAARYGGEEFAIVLPDTAIEQAVVLAEQIRSRMASRSIVRRDTGKAMGSITLSIGAAQYHHGEGLSALIGRADAALYAAKDGGRNRVTAELHPAHQVRMVG
ncbi:diguanylate cyclase [Inquilinus sp. CAU 1745]|uniref:diguanylate cyclase n=1 Tax=Inquilinus sp. CAU 1745 TaxID=3140369 RepID=UPI00325BA577